MSHLQVLNGSVNSNEICEWTGVVAIREIPVFSKEHYLQDFVCCNSQIDNEKGMPKEGMEVEFDVAVIMNQTKMQS